MQGQNPQIAIIDWIVRDRGHARSRDDVAGKSCNSRCPRAWTAGNLNAAAVVSPVPDALYLPPVPGHSIRLVFLVVLVLYPQQSRGGLNLYDHDDEHLPHPRRPVARGLQGDPSGRDPSQQLRRRSLASDTTALCACILRALSRSFLGVAGVQLVELLLQAVLYFVVDLCGLFDDARVSAHERKGGRLEDNDVDIGSLRGQRAVGYAGVQ